jgi:aminoglycoside phosphotransferase (APT) family kinase protein
MTDPWTLVPSQFLTHDQAQHVTGRPAQALRTWLRRRLGLELQRLSRRAGGGGGFKSTVYFAGTDGGPLVVRVPRRGTGWNARLLGCPDYHCIAGAYAIARLAALGQPVPELLLIERDCEVLGAPFAVFRRVSGVHMADYCERWTRWPYPEEQWGEFLRACHGIEPVRGAGPVDDAGTGWCASWSEYVTRLLLARAGEFAHLLPSDFPAHWERLLASYSASLDARPVRLLHLESNGYCNLILDPHTRRIKAVLDFEEVTAGDPLFELVAMAWYLGRHGIADHGGRTCFEWRRFYRGYGPVNWRHPLVPVYRTLILLEKLWRPDRERRLRGLLRLLRRAECRGSPGALRRLEPPRR